ncbi:MAG: DUF1949 domain-containing protein [Nocardioidaceae bacterium]|nr:DUF1949 domain-containing protein [Nocardioidaceae bacterium]
MARYLTVRGTTEVTVEVKKSRFVAQLVVVRVGHAEAGRVENAVRQQGLAVEQVEHGIDVRITLAVRPLDVETTVSHLSQLTSGRARTELGGTHWVDVLADGSYLT